MKLRARKKELFRHISFNIFTRSRLVRSVRTMPLTNIHENEHEQFVSMFQQLVNEREGLARENEYLKAKMNESVLMETIREMKKERDFLLKLLSNLTKNNQQDEQRK